MDKITRLGLGVDDTPPRTSSRARELPEPQNSALLRDAWHPEGVPTLKDDELRKVQAANQLFGFSATVWQLCCSLGIMCVIQNPHRSWMWFGQEMVGVLSMGCTKVRKPCMHVRSTVSLMDLRRLCTQADSARRLPSVQ